MRRLLVSTILLFLLTNLLFAGRYYDAATGRFLQIDPHASKYPSLSPYSYVANNPLNAVDPDGKDIKMIHRKPKGDAGHIAIQVIDGESGKIMATWSFGPEDGASMLKMGLGGDVSGAQTADMDTYLEGKDFEESTIETDSDTDKKTADSINDRKGENEDYNLYDNNCGTTAVEIINEAGVEVESGSILPSSVYNDFNEAKKKREEQKKQEDE